MHFSLCKTNPFLHWHPLNWQNVWLQFPGTGFSQVGGQALGQSTTSAFSSSQPENYALTMFPMKDSIHNPVQNAQFLGSMQIPFLSLTRPLTQRHPGTQGVPGGSWAHRYWMLFKYWSQLGSGGHFRGHGSIISFVLHISFGLDWYSTILIFYVYS